MGSFDGQAEAEADAPIEAVFASLLRLDRVSEWQPSVREFECLARDADGYPSRIRVELDTPVKTVRAILDVTYTHPTSMVWTMAEGDAKSFDGAWRLTALDGDRTRITYELEIDMGGKIGLMLRGPVKTVGRAVVSSMPGRLRDFVEAER